MNTDSTPRQEQDVEPRAEVNTETAAATPAPAPRTVPAYVGRCAVIGFILGVLGWVMLLVNEWAALVPGVLGLAACIAGCRRPRSNMRNLAITGIIISGVLVLDIIIIKCAIAYLSSL